MGQHLSHCTRRNTIPPKAPIMNMFEINVAAGNFSRNWTDGYESDDSEAPTADGSGLPVWVPAGASEASDAAFAVAENTELFVIAVGRAARAAVATMVQGAGLETSLLGQC